MFSWEKFIVIYSYYVTSPRHILKLKLTHEKQLSLLYLNTFPKLDSGPQLTEDCKE